MKKDKEKALNLLKQKTNGEIKISYQEIANKTGYSRMQINRFLTDIEKKDIDQLLIHGLTGLNSNNSASTEEIEYIKNIKPNKHFFTVFFIYVFCFRRAINKREIFFYKNYKRYNIEFLSTFMVFVCVYFVFGFCANFKANC